jgi:Tol biopolymer transport system component
MEAWNPTLSRDGKNLAFIGLRAGKWELWEKSLADGREAPLVVARDDVLVCPQWSPDGTRVAYLRFDPKQSQLFTWSDESRTAEPVTSGSSTTVWVPYDWSPDGNWLLVTHVNHNQARQQGGSEPAALWMLPLAAAPQAEAKARKVTSDPAYAIYQGHFSPDGRWIVFEGQKNGAGDTDHALYVVPASGGPRTRVTERQYLDDKPRWSPDGKTIYFVSGRLGFFNVWGIRFDPVKGQPVGKPFRVTTFDSPSLRVPEADVAVELSLTPDRFVLNLKEVSGSIWVLDNVDR